MKKIIGAAIGSCVHIGGLHHFLKAAEAEGYTAISFGPAVSVARLVKLIEQEKPDIVAVSYRLTPDSAEGLFSDLESELTSAGIRGCRMVFGGTPPVVAVAARQVSLKDFLMAQNLPVQWGNTCAEGQEVKPLPPGRIIVDG
jgi:methanogenic corrinoid protein MtbC1